MVGQCLPQDQTAVENEITNMKAIALAVALAAFFGAGIAIKTWQYRSCISDGMSPRDVPRHH